MQIYACMYPNIYLTLHLLKSPNDAGVYVGLCFFGRYHSFFCKLVHMDINITTYQSSSNRALAMPNAFHRLQVISSNRSRTRSTKRNTQYHKLVSQQMPNLIGFTFCVAWGICSQPANPSMECDKDCLIHN